MGAMRRQEMVKLVKDQSLVSCYYYFLVLNHKKWRQQSGFLDPHVNVHRDVEIRILFSYKYLLLVPPLSVFISLFQ